jgi:hypothetical protein
MQRRGDAAIRQEKLCVAFVPLAGRLGVRVFQRILIFRRMVTRYFHPEQIPFDYKRAYGFLKIRSTSDKFAAMHAMVTRLHAQYQSCFEPRYRYAVHQVIRGQSGSFSVLLDGSVSFVGQGIHRLLAESRYAAVFVLTVGDKIDAEMAKLAQQDFTEAYFLDGVASAMTDGLLQLLKRDLREEAARLGGALAYRFSPGYARWDLQEQEKIFKLLKGEEIGMALSETYFMVPQKSLSGVFGFKPIASNNKTG